jgi:hypothetical protein
MPHTMALLWPDNPTIFEHLPVEIIVLISNWLAVTDSRRTISSFSQVPNDFHLALYRNYTEEDLLELGQLEVS